LSQVTLSACQQCVRTMNTYARRNKIPIEVMDVIQLVERAVKV
jgi:heterodisulfide reductase subunit D